MNIRTARKLEHRGITFYVGPKTPFPGIGWAIPTYDHLKRRNGFRESGGAFYDGCEDHPEGAYEWAEVSARRVIDKALEDQNIKG